MSGKPGSGSGSRSGGNNRERSYAYPRNWPGWPPASAASQGESSGNAAENSPAAASANTPRPGGNSARSPGQGSPQTPAGSSRTTGPRKSQQSGGPGSSSSNWRARQNPPASPSKGGAGMGGKMSGEPKKPRQFRPMDVVETGRSKNYDVTPEQKKMLGFSEYYQGDPLNPKNRSDDIPEEESTSLYLYHLPPTITVKLLLDTLVKYGPFDKIYQSNIKPADPERGYDNAGAKIATYTRAGAVALKNFLEHGPFKINGYRVPVKWNTQKVREFRLLHAGKMYMSRAVQIQGPKHLVNLERLWNFFTSKFKFDIQDVYLVAEDKETRTLNFVFASVKAQSESAFLALKEPQWAEVQFTYGVDPISRPWSEVRRWRSLASQLPSLGNFDRTSEPTTPRQRPVNFYDEVEEEEEGPRPNLYDAEDSDEERPHFDYENDE